MIVPLFREEDIKTAICVFIFTGGSCETDMVFKVTYMNCTMLIGFCFKHFWFPGKFKKIYPMAVARYVQSIG
jgi:hypothetical protein